MLGALFREYKGRYGSPRLQRELRARGILANRKRVARLMRVLGLRAKSSRRFKATTNAKHRFPFDWYTNGEHLTTPKTGCLCIAACLGGVPKKFFHLYLAETAFRFNHREQDLYPLLYKALRQIDVAQLK